jgi:hypothetical protein
MLYTILALLLLWPSLAFAAFDMGFDFRGSSGFVTDPAYAVCVLATDIYPHTYTSSNGDSGNGGWDSSGMQNLNDSSSNDPRIAGSNYTSSGTTHTFIYDLSSGSAPGAGPYAVDFALGDAGNSATQDAILKDNTTALITITSTATTAGHFIDATGTNVAATTTWTGTTVNKTWASTTVNFALNPSSAAIFTTLAHFRLTAAGGSGGTTATTPQRTMTGVGL